MACKEIPDADLPDPREPTVFSVAALWFSFYYCSCCLIFFFFFAMSASSALFSIVKHPFAVVERQLEGGRSAALKRETRSEARRKSSRKRKRKLKRNQSVKNAEQLRIQKKRKYGDIPAFFHGAARAVYALSLFLLFQLSRSRLFFSQVYFSLLFIVVIRWCFEV